MIILKYINGFHSAFIIIIVVIFYVLNCYQHNDTYIFFILLHIYININNYILIILLFYNI